MVGGISSVFHLTIVNKVVWDKILTEISPLRDIIRNQMRINDEVDKKIYVTDKLLKNINIKMDNFTVSTQKQLSFNKMLETQIQQISTAISSRSIEDFSKTPFKIM
jgi:hypothetical protein